MCVCVCAQDGGVGGMRERDTHTERGGPKLAGLKCADVSDVQKRSTAVGKKMSEHALKTNQKAF